MTPINLKLYELLGDKTLSFGCKLESYGFGVCDYVRTDNGRKMLIDRFDDVVYDDGGFLVIGHEPTIADLHRVFASLKIGFAQYNGEILCTSFETGKQGFDRFDYDSSKSLLLQSEETKSLIISLITSYS